jgi:hypothetical protein
MLTQNIRAIGIWYREMPGIGGVCALLPRSLDTGVNSWVNHKATEEERQGFGMLPESRL